MSLLFLRFFFFFCHSLLGEIAAYGWFALKASFSFVGKTALVLLGLLLKLSSPFLLQKLNDLFCLIPIRYCVVCFVTQGGE